LCLVQLKLDYYRNGFGIRSKSNSLEFLAPTFVLISCRSSICLA